MLCQYMAAALLMSCMKLIGSTKYLMVHKSAALVAPAALMMVYSFIGLLHYKKATHDDIMADTWRITWRIEGRPGASN